MLNNVNQPSEHQGVPWEISNRIPSYFSAKHYDLYMHPNLTSRRFSGNVTITIETSQSTTFFIVHAKQLEIKKDSLKLKHLENDAEKDVPVMDAFEYIPNQFYVVQADAVSAGTYKLFMEFKGSLEGKIVGFYSSAYTTPSDQTRSLATTKFQPTYAREAFPCFDEPSFRSTYQVTIVMPSNNNYIGLSNMPIMSEKPNSPTCGLTEVHFHKSVPMVSYLVCFIVCDFTYKEINTKTLNGEIPFRVYAPINKIEDMHYALNFGSKTLQFYEEMFDSPFPLPKSDMAAIPDYSSGATEHWGLITYRETRIFYNEKRSSASSHQDVATVIAHELVHQWFGNLVTLNWWNDLWLNEGFASYIQYKGTNFAHPSWDMNAQFIVERLQVVFELDSQLSSHPIIKVVQTPEEINAMFDRISYDKGSSVLRMLEGFMGESFQKGVNQFLKDFAFQTAVTQDLWQRLTDAWKENVSRDEKTDIADLMDPWTRQMGYPVVTVQQTSPRHLTLTQSRFLLDPEAKYNPSESPFGYKWDISISLLTSFQPLVKKYWFYREAEKLVIDLGTEVTWFKLNHQQIGYYCVNYDPEMWAKLQDLCASLSLIPEDRSSLYNDALALADAARLDYEVALNLTQSLIHEDHYVPWKSASRKLKTINYLLLQSDVEEPFKTYIMELVKPIYTKLQWTSQGSHLERLLRSVIIDLASMSGLRSSLEEAGHLLQAWIDNEGYPLPVDLKRQIYWWGMIRSGSNANWNIMWQRCMAELDAGEKNNLYYGLANSQDPQTLDKYINLAFDLANTRMQEFLSIVQYISSNPVGTDIAWNWLRNNWDGVINRYGTNNRYLGQLILKVTQYFRTPQRSVEIESFYDRNSQSGAVAQYRKQALDAAKTNIHWVNSYAPTILRWLSKRIH